MQVEINVPTSASEIHLKTYQRFMAIDQNADGDFIARKMLDIFCGVKEILKVRHKDVALVYSKLIEVLSANQELQPIISINGNQYGFIPDLENITFGEFIDLDSLMTWDNMHKAMAVLYRPITKRYNDLYEIEEYESSSKYSDVMKECPLDIVLGANVFFYHLSNDLLSGLVKHLKQMKTEKPTTAQEDSSKQNTDGLERLTDLRMEILQGRTQSPAYERANAFIHFLTMLKKTELIRSK